MTGAEKAVNENRLTDRLRCEIDARGLSSYRLSKMSGVDVAVLSRFRSGRRGLRLATADRLCEALGLALKPEEDGT